MASNMGIDENSKCDLRFAIFNQIYLQKNLLCIVLLGIIK